MKVLIDDRRQDEIIEEIMNMSEEELEKMRIDYMEKNKNKK